jgi:high-affinity Fe2+/Pb2+ permease
MQIVALLIVFLGEFLAITSEIFFSKGKYMYTMVFIMFIAWCLLLGGYWLAHKYMGSLWPIYIATITAILILEPIIIYYITGESPNLGAKIGFVLGVAGCFAALGIS